MPVSRMTVGGALLAALACAKMCCAENPVADQQHGSGPHEAGLVTDG